MLKERVDDTQERVDRREAADTDGCWLEVAGKSRYCWVGAVFLLFARFGVASGHTALHVLVILAIHGWS